MDMTPVPTAGDDRLFTSTARFWRWLWRQPSPILIVGRRLCRPLCPDRDDTALTLRGVDQTLEQAIAALRRLPYAEYLKTAHWQRVRGVALEQAGYACDLCARDKNLEVHHRTYERIGFERQSDLIVLCHDCHQDHHKALILRAIRATERAALAVSVADVLKKVE